MVGAEKKLVLGRTPLAVDPTCKELSPVDTALNAETAPKKLESVFVAVPEGALPGVPLWSALRTATDVDPVAMATSWH